MKEGPEGNERRYRNKGKKAENGEG